MKINWNVLSGIAVVLFAVYMSTALYMDYRAKQEKIRLLQEDKWATERKIKDINEAYQKRIDSLYGR